MADRGADDLAGEAVEHMTHREVMTILSVIDDESPILVGGQSLNLWAKVLSPHSEWLAKTPMTSEDIDFMRNDGAAKKLATLLGTTVLTPKADDQTPSAALVAGKLNGREIRVDFMRNVHGVEDKFVLRRSVTISGLLDPQTKQPLKLKVMHPIDCLVSRFANMNGPMGRVGSEHSRRQAKGAIAIADAYVEQLLQDGNTRPAQELLASIEYVMKDFHLGKASHTRFGNEFPMLDILRARLGDERLDIRWREMVLAKSLARCEEMMAKYEARRAAKGDASPGFGFNGADTGAEGAKPLVETFADRVRRMRSPPPADHERDASGPTPPGP